jgi:hypothetical protein
MTLIKGVDTRQGLLLLIHSKLGLHFYCLFIVNLGYISIKLRLQQGQVEPLVGSKIQIRILLVR